MTTEGQRPPGAPENRSEVRQARQIRFKGELSLRLPGVGAETPVAALRDVSASGASVLLPQQCLTGTAVSVLLRANGVRIEYLGNVAWCRIASEADALESNWPGPEPLYAVGLHIRGSGSFAAMVTSR